MPYAFIGDFNVAPRDQDVWDISLFTDSTHVIPVECEAFANVQSISLSEVMPRALKGEPYTFWDYRNGALHRGWGMPIDLVLGNAPFINAVSATYVDREARKSKGVSNQAPVVLDLTEPVTSAISREVQTRTMNEEDGLSGHVRRNADRVNHPPVSMS